MVSTPPRVDTIRHLAAALREWDFDGQVPLFANSDANAERLSDTGATIILKPYRAGVDRILERARGPSPAGSSSE